MVPSFLLTVNPSSSGNLRSSPEIAALIVEFQRFIGGEIAVTGQPVVSSIDWPSTPPDIAIFHDDSDDRLAFLHNCQTKLERLAEEHEEVMVSPFMHMTLRRALEILCQSLENVRFGYSEKVLGCQYPCMVIILDVATCIPPKSSLVNSLTRATTDLHVYVNDSLEPAHIDGTPLGRLEVHSKGRAVEERVSELVSSAYLAQGKKALIYDFYHLLDQNFTTRIQETAATTSWFWFGSEEETREKTKEFSLVVGIFPSGNLDAELPFLFFPAYIEIMAVDLDKMEEEAGLKEQCNDGQCSDTKKLVEGESVMREETENLSPRLLLEEEEMDKRRKVRMMDQFRTEYDLRRLRQETIDFFIQYKDCRMNRK